MFPTSRRDVTVACTNLSVDSRDSYALTLLMFLIWQKAFEPSLFTWAEIGIEYYTHIPNMGRSTDCIQVDVNWPNNELAQVLCRAED